MVGCDVLFLLFEIVSNDHIRLRCRIRISFESDDVVGQFPSYLYYWVVYPITFYPIIFYPSIFHEDPMFAGINTHHIMGFQRDCRTFFSHERIVAMEMPDEIPWIVPMRSI